MRLENDQLKSIRWHIGRLKGSIKHYEQNSDTTVEELTLKLNELETQLIAELAKPTAKLSEAQIEKLNEKREQNNYRRALHKFVAQKRSDEAAARAAFNSITTNIIN